MKNPLLFLILVVLACNSCEKGPDPRFLIAEDQVGYLNRNTPIAELESVFANDSVVRDTLGFKLGKVREQLRVFEKGGTHLLTITPSGDSIPTAANVRILDPRFTTAGGIGINSAYGDIEAAYNIQKINTALNNVVLILKNSNLYVTIAKSELPENVRYANKPVEAVQIPDKARLKYLMVGWD